MKKSAILMLLGTMCLNNTNATTDKNGMKVTDELKRLSIHVNRLEALSKKNDLIESERNKIINKTIKLANDIESNVDRIPPSSPSATYPIYLDYGVIPASTITRESVKNIINKSKLDYNENRYSLFLNTTLYKLGEYKREAYKDRLNKMTTNHNFKEFVSGSYESNFKQIKFTQDSLSGSITAIDFSTNESNYKTYKTFRVLNTFVNLIPFVQSFIPEDQVKTHKIINTFNKYLG